MYFLSHMISSIVEKSRLQRPGKRVQRLYVKISGDQTRVQRLGRSAATSQGSSGCEGEVDASITIVNKKQWQGS